MSMTLIYGLIALICGAFMLTYGASLFRFVLAFAGFYIGFTIGMMLPIDSSALKLLLALVLGGVAGVALYSLVNMTLYLAGGILGLVVGMIIATLAGQTGGWLGSVLSLAGAAVGAFFGRSLGEWASVLASAGLGAYASVVGLNLLLNPSVVDAGNGFMPRTLPAFLVLLVLFAVSVLAQMQIQSLRRRLMRR